ncbi:PD-(D/E)XK nuclease family protein [Echinicola jeungdonensis]|uniref:PD-(D/E)XK nuclease family protein n=1 Tax=Echinicola jeungdonensis TaxID=709343 RepID=A0ABV5J6Z8_9BACT|nr:PD-(D/E)XK nuclease family protein [Echinicola jeungdonensis]MDN3668043.1 PD-(D/E)XK nuclease family protein [Echinicola jeungdonensis]
MESFLKETARDILTNYPNLSRITVVLPNRRAGLFFNRHLGHLINEPQWMPEVKTVEDLFYELAGQKSADPLTLIFELYKVYTDLKSNPETFDRFYFWGEMILKDFNDLDQFLVDPEKLYGLLEDIKTLEGDISYLTEGQIELIQQFWKSFERDGGPQQEKFVKFWQILLPLYRSYQGALEIAGLGYSGKLYRKVVENLEDIPKPENQYIFVGFNAFTGTEERLIKHYIKQFDAQIYWDLDAYYIQSKVQEAGLFFRDYQKDKIFGPTFPKEMPSHIQSQPPTIKSYVTPLKVSQANLISHILESSGQNEALEETVVILPDEQLLFPVMQQLPSNIDKVNVTMGYPIRNAPVYAFLEAVLELQRYVKLEEGEIKFYHRPVKELLSSVYLRTGQTDFVHDFLTKTQEQNKVYISQQDLYRGGKLFELIFQKLSAQELFGYLETLIKELAEMLVEEKLQRSYLYQCHKQLVRLKEIFKEQKDIEVSLEFFIRLFRQIFREVRLPFEGEPLEGLQVMGVLESRNLDFKKVIIANMNEGSFPPSASLNSLIPFNVRKGFGLPVQEQNDAIYAYTFYRLLHRAEELHMIYATASDQGKVGEKSRYIHQMEVELGIEIPEEVVFTPVDLGSTPEISIPKTPAVKELMDKYLLQEEGKSITAFSPSALNVWLDCRLKFYFQYLANIREQDKVEEEVDAAVFGNLAHYSLENLYKGFIYRKKRRVVEREDFENLKEFVFPAIEKSIRDFYHLSEEKDTRLSGQLAIVRDVLQHYIQELLKMDMSSAPFELISLEKDQHYKTSVPIEVGGRIQNVVIKGIIDRVDRQDGTVRLIDYKSGMDKKEFKGIDSLFERENKNRNKAAMQTMIYGLLYKAKFPDNQLALKPAIYNLREIFGDDFNPYLQLKPEKGPKVEVNDYRDYEVDFERGLKRLFEEIFDPEQPFDQTDDLDKCNYCPYKDICGR